MKNTILRILISAIVFSLIVGVVVLIIGLIAGWKTYTQFSDGFFWAGTIMILIGVMFLLGYGERIISTSSTTPSLTPKAYLSPTEHSSRLAEDTLRGKKLLGIFGISGLLLFGLSFLAILVGRLF